ncbi:MAG: putative porin, partial [Chlorobi bacterium]|nr:putative porin [Chlorobiota bacterium]
MRKKYIKILLITIALFSTSKLAFAQHDADSLTNILLIWNLDDNFERKYIPLSDSSAYTFHIISKEDKNSILSSNLGNFGSANISDIFIKREDKFNEDFSFNSPYYLFIKDSKTVNYYDTRRPFTSAMHSTSFKVNNIQTLKFTHTQNVNPNFNIAADFDYTTSLGLYISQKTSLSTISLSTNYKKDKYQIYASYVRNKIDNLNSGGYIDSIGSDQVFPEGLMKEVHFLIKNQELSATQIYSFGTYKNISYKDSIIKILEPKTSISHSISLYQKYRVYTDQETIGSKLPNPSFYYQEGETSDSTSLRGISNKFRYASEKLFENEHKFKFSIILNADLKEYYNFKDYIFLENSNV